MAETASRLAFCTILLNMASMQIALQDAGEYTACAGKPADIVFILDSSNSIMEEDYTREKEFVRDVLGSFDIGPDKMRVGAVTFSDGVHNQFDMGTYSDKKSLKEAVEEIPYSGGGTHTHKALHYLRNVPFGMDNARPDVPRIGIVLTDGLSHDAELTREEAFLAREDGIILFVIGIGLGVDENELKSMASEPHEYFVLQVDDFTALSNIKDKLAIKACKAQENVNAVKPAKGEDTIIAEACGGKPADVIFALDTSTSIYMEDYQKQLEFVSEVVDMFDIGQDSTRVGLFIFSDESYPQFSLTSFNSKPRLRDAIMEVEYVGGGTFTNNALQYMRDQAFKPSMERPDAVRIGIILTDGMSHSSRKTLHQAKLTQKYATIFVIGIGFDTDEDELNGIATDPDQEHRFMIDDFDALKSIKKTLAIKACTVKAVNTSQRTDAEDSSPEDCKNLKPTDLVFGIDTARFGNTANLLILKFINNLLAAFDVGSERTQISMLTTSCAVGHDIPLSDHLSRSAFQQDILNLNAGDYDDLVKKVRRVGLITANGARDSAGKMALFFLKDEPRNVDKLASEIKRAQYSKVAVYFVGIGTRFDKSVLIRLFGKNFHQFFVEADDISELENVRDGVIQMLCPRSLTSWTL